MLRCRLAQRVTSALCPFHRAAPQPALRVGVLFSKDGGRKPPMPPSPLRGAGKHQNKKYRCAIGSVSAGAQVSNSPSARTS